MVPVPFSVTFSIAMTNITYFFMNCNCFVRFLSFSQFCHTVFMHFYNSFFTHSISLSGFSRICSFFTMVRKIIAM